MTSRKYNRVAKLSSTYAYPATFRARINAIPEALAKRLTAAEIAIIIDEVQASSFNAGHASGMVDAR